MLLIGIARGFSENTQDACSQPDLGSNMLQLQTIRTNTDTSSVIPALMQIDWLSSSTMWLWSVFLTLLGTTLSSSGLLLQKYSHQRAPDAPDNDASNLYFFSLTWLLGLVVFVTGQLFCFLGLALGPQIMLSCLNVWSMIVTFLIAPVVFKEEVNITKIGTAALIMVGIVLVIVYGPHTYHTYTVLDFESGFSNPTFIAASAVYLIFVTIALLRGFFRAASPGMTPIEFAVLAVIFGSYSVLSAKTSAAIFLTWATEEHNPFGFFALIMPLVMLCFACSNLHFMNMALKYGEAVTIVPLYESLSIINQVFLGGVFFGTLEQVYTSGHFKQFLAGLLCVTLGAGFMIEAHVPNDVQKADNENEVTEVLQQN